MASTTRTSQQAADALGRSGALAEASPSLRAMPTAEHWSESDHELMDGFLSQVFDEAVAGILERRQFADRLAYVMTTLYMGEHLQALQIFRDSAQLRSSAKRRLSIVPT